MAVVDVLDNTGNKVSEVELSDSVFSVPVNKSVLHQVLVSQLSSKRAGTVGVKGRSDIVGSGRKLYRQKGTGRARKGDIKSPLLRGGGVIFGPTARSYTKKVMKKVRRSALRMALTAKLKENKIIVIDNFRLTIPKTKFFVQTIKNLSIFNSLIVESDKCNFLHLSSRNIPGIKVLNYKGLNVLDILKYSKLVLVESSIKGIEGKLL